MAGVMRLLEEAESRGYYDTDKIVCSICIEESALQTVIRKQGIAEQCDYCGKRTRKPSAAAVESIMPAVASALGYYYAEPTHAGVP